MTLYHKLLFCFCLFVLLWSISNCRNVLQVSCHFDSLKWCSWDDPTKISRDPKLTELTRNHRTCCMLLRSKYCTRKQFCCISLTCKTFQRYVSFKICKGLFYWNDYCNFVRRFVVSDPELPDSLYTVLGGVLNPNSFGGYLTIFSLFVNNCKWDFEQTIFDRSFI